MKENLISHGGCNLKINNKKKGYTLLEVVAVIGMSTIAMIIGITIIINIYKNYINIKKDIMRADQIDNALLNIDRLLTGYMITEIKPSSKDSEIEVKYLMKHKETSIKSKIIKVQRGNLVVETYNKEESMSALNTMPILKEVKNFSIIQKENIYYYKITLKTGEEIINCI